MITEQIATWAERTPFRTAIRHNGRNLSYAAFAHAIALARGFLGTQDLGREGLVAVAARNALDFWTISLAARSLGKTTMLIADASDLGDGVGHVIVAAREKWPKLAGRCAQLGLPLLICTLEGQCALRLDAGAAVALGGHILSTSGTTGHRKRLLIDPSIEADYHGARRDLLGIDADTMFHLFHLPAWTGSGYKTPITIWAAGGGVILDDRPAWHEALRARDATHAVMVPAMLRALLAMPADAFPSHPNLQLSITGGVAAETMVEGAKARISPIVFNRLSASETSIFGFTRIEQPEDRLWHRIVPGRAVEVIDEEGRPVPAGTLGRVRVSTQGGPTGYYDDPEASRTFFRDGFFYPGDLGMFRDDGRLMLHGRVTDIINLQGHKLAPAVVEDHIAAKLGIAEICIFSVPAGDGGDRLHAVISNADAAKAERLVAALQGELGVETKVGFLDALPRTETGKLRREAIKQSVLGAT